MINHMRRSGKLISGFIFAQCAIWIIGLGIASNIYVPTWLAYVVVGTPFVVSLCLLGLIDHIDRGKYIKCPTDKSNIRLQVGIAIPVAIFFSLAHSLITLTVRRTNEEGAKLVSVLRIESAFREKSVTSGKLILSRPDAMAFVNGLRNANIQVIGVQALVWSDGAFRLLDQQRIGVMATNQSTRAVSSWDDAALFMSRHAVDNSYFKIDIDE